VKNLAGDQDSFGLDEEIGGSNPLDDDLDFLVGLQNDRTPQKSRRSKRDLMADDENWQIKVDKPISDSMPDSRSDPKGSVKAIPNAAPSKTKSRKSSVSNTAKNLNSTNNISNNDIPRKSSVSNTAKNPYSTKNIFNNDKPLPRNSSPNLPRRKTSNLADTSGLSSGALNPDRENSKTVRKQPTLLWPSSSKRPDRKTSTNRHNKLSTPAASDQKTKPGNTISETPNQFQAKPTPSGPKGKTTKTTKTKPQKAKDTQKSPADDPNPKKSANQKKSIKPKRPKDPKTDLDYLEKPEPKPTKKSISENFDPIGLSSINSSKGELSDGENSLAEKVDYWGNDHGNILAGLDKKSKRKNNKKTEADAGPKVGRRQTIDKLIDFDFDGSPPRDQDIKATEVKRSDWHLLDGLSEFSVQETKKKRKISDIDD
jgi:hypothetical protein